MSAASTSQPTRVEGFRVNGCTVSIDEPHSFIDQANAVAICLSHAIGGGGGTPNDEIVDAALRAISTLTQLAAYGAMRLDEARAATIAQYRGRK